MNITTLWRTTLLLAAILGISACTDSTSSSSRTLRTDTYLFYYNGIEPNASLMAVDPADPRNPITVTNTMGTPTYFAGPTFYVGGTTHPGSRTISDLHYRALLYPDQQGANTVLRLTLAHKSEGLSSRQVSNETAANTICNYAGFDDYTNIDHSLIIYNRNGVDNNCATTNDNDGWILSLGTDSTVAPFGGGTTFRPIGPVYNPDGSIKGALWHFDGSGLWYYDAAYAADNSVTFVGGNFVINQPAVTSVQIADSVDPHGRMILKMNGGLYVYNPTTNTVSIAVYPSTTVGQIQFDDNYAYFADAAVIYRVPMDGSGPATPLVDESAVPGISMADETITLTANNNIIYYYTVTSGGTDTLIRSINKGGGTATTIYTIPDPDSISNLLVSNGRVYITTSNTIGVSVGEDGSDPRVEPNTMWVGFTYSHQQRMFADYNPNNRQSFGVKGSMRPAAIFRSTVYPDTFNSSLVSFDADTSEFLVDFGVPTPEFLLGPGLYPPSINHLTSNGNTLMWFIGNDPVLGSSTDILFINARNRNTMARVTSDSVEDKKIGFVSGCTLGNGRIDPLLPMLMLLAGAYLWRRRSTAGSRQ